MDLLSGETAALALLGAFFLAGSIAGCVLAGLVQTGGQDELAAYLRSYLTLLEDDAARPGLAALSWEVLRFPLLAFLLGFTALGIIGLPVLFAARGFLLSFAVSAFYRLFGFSGALPAFFLFGLSALIWLPVLFHLGVQGLLAAYSLLRRGLGEGRYPLRYDARYLARCGLCACALAGCVALEYFAVPALLRAAAGIF